MAVLTKTSLAPQDKFIDRGPAGLSPAHQWGWTQRPSMRSQGPRQGDTTEPSPLGWTWHFLIVWSLLLLGHSQKNKIQNWGAVGRVMKTHVQRPLTHNMMSGIDLPSIMTSALTSSVFGSVWRSQCLEHWSTHVFCHKPGGCNRKLSHDFA